MRKYAVILFLLAVAAVGAQEPALPTLEANDRDFFDPTRVEKPKEPYNFDVHYRVEAGYVQNAHLSDNKTYENTYMHGFRLGATADFLLPLHFSMQAGILYTFTYGTAMQNWAYMSYEDYVSPDPVTGMVYAGKINHHLYEHQLTIPVRAYYTIPLWRQLNLFFYTGPQLQIGLALKDDMQADLSTATKQWFASVGQPYEPYDRYAAGELYRTTFQWGLGGGFEWDRYRLQAGYDFGLNNQVKKRLIQDRKMWEWHWFVSFAYKL
ncbi:MAG: outer membrane beta-barrel protein [Paludibacteraceae bacterium]|nr:outer membrane beta-barrel protein [Paludibacteraceae bacterium]